MGNSKSSTSCMPICGEREDLNSSQKRIGKFKKTATIQKMHEQRINLKHMLEEEAYQRQENVKSASPIDNCFEYLMNQLSNSKSEWGAQLLYNYAEKMKNLMEEKYKTYNWNIEVNLQDEALRYEAIRECLSDSNKEDQDGDEFNVSSSDERDVYSQPQTNEDGQDRAQMQHRPGAQGTVIEERDDPFNEGAAAIGKDGSMVLMKNSNIFQFNNQGSKFRNNVINTQSSQMPPPSQSQEGSKFDGSRPSTGDFGEALMSIDQSNTVHNPLRIEENVMSQQLSPNQEDQLIGKQQKRQAHQTEIHRKKDPKAEAERIQMFLERKRENDLFKRKVHIIKRHFRSTHHPLRMLADLFADEVERIHKRDMKGRNSDMGSEEDLSRSQMNQKNTRTQIKLSERQKEDDNQNQYKAKRFKALQQTVQDFSLLLKHAIIRFYQIEYNKLRAFQKNYFSEKVKHLVLGYKVSKILHLAAADAHREEIIEFSKAQGFMNKFDLEFYQVPPQFHLDENYYIKEKSKVVDAPIKIIQKNMEKAANQFSMQRLSANKSQVEASTQMKKSTEKIKGKSIRVSDRGARPSPIMMQGMDKLMKDLTLKDLGFKDLAESQDDTAAQAAALDKQENNKATFTNDSSSIRDTEIIKKQTPYMKTISVLKQIENVTSLKKKRAIFIYAWKKLQKEVLDYWKDKNTTVPQHKLQICEDQRLCLMAFVIVQSQCADIFASIITIYNIYTFKLVLCSFLALNPFIDFNSMEEAVPLATVENAIQVIIKDYNERQGAFGEELSNLDGPIDMGSRHDIASQQRLMIPSNLSDNMSFRSTNYMNQIQDYKRQLEEIKFRSSNIFRASNIDQANMGLSNITPQQFDNTGGIPVHQLCGPFQLVGGDVDMRQEEEEEELHRRLNNSNDEEFEYDDQDRFESLKQRETLKRWQQNNAIVRGTSFKNPRQKYEGLGTSHLMAMMRRSHAASPQLAYYSYLILRKVYDSLDSNNSQHRPCSLIRPI